MLPKEKKSEIVQKFGKTTKDTGSAQVQIALLTEKISALSLHLQGHLKDHHSRRGLLKMVGARRSLLQYLKVHSAGTYKEITQALNLRK